MYIETEIIGNIGILVLNHASTNSLNKEFLQEVMHGICLFEDTDTIKVISILSKLPFGFSSGLDLGSLFEINSSKQTADKIFEAVEMVYWINNKILNSKKIYVAALAGPVIGSAVSLALSCDFRLADENAWFWLPDPQYGGFLADGGIDMLRKMVGVSRANMMLITNDRISARIAYEWGLLYAITQRKLLNETVMKLCKRLADYSAHTLWLTKEKINNHIVGDFQKDKLREIVDSIEMYNRIKSYF